MGEERQKKIRLMKIGIVLVMALILFFWLLNFRNVWRLSNRSVVVGPNNWSQSKDNFSRSINDLQNRLDKIGEAQKKAEDEANRSLVAELIKNTASLASSTASSTEEIASSSPTSSELLQKITKPKNKK